MKSSFPPELRVSGPIAQSLCVFLIVSLIWPAHGIVQEGNAFSEGLRVRSGVLVVNGDGDGQGFPLFVNASGGLDGVAMFESVDADSRIHIRSAVSSSSKIRMESGVGGATYELGLSTNFYITPDVVNTGLDAPFQVNSVGNVGLGVSPGSDYRLQVNARGGAEGVALFAQPQGNARVQLQCRDDLHAFFRFQRGSNPPSYEMGNSPDDVFYINHVAGAGSGGAAITIRKSDGHVGIRGAPFAQGTFGVNGNIVSTGGTSVVSDARLKKNVIPIGSDAMDAIDKLRPVRYEYNSESNILTEEQKGALPTGRQVGFLAQEVEAILPELVHVSGDNPDGFRTVSYEKFTPILVGAVKELAARVEELSSQLMRMQEVMNSMQAQIDK